MYEFEGENSDLRRGSRTASSWIFHRKPEPKALALLVREGMTGLITEEGNLYFPPLDFLLLNFLYLVMDSFRKVVCKSISFCPLASACSLQPLKKYPSLNLRSRNAAVEGWSCCQDTKTIKNFCSLSFGCLCLTPMFCVQYIDQKNSAHIMYFCNCTSVWLLQ